MSTGWCAINHTTKQQKTGLYSTDVLGPNGAKYLKQTTDTSNRSCKKTYNEVHDPKSVFAKLTVPEPLKKKSPSCHVCEGTFTTLTGTNHGCQSWARRLHFTPSNPGVFYVVSSLDVTSQTAVCILRLLQATRPAHLNFLYPMHINSKNSLCAAFYHVVQQTRHLTVRGSSPGRTMRFFSPL
jgi:hypothetical protein